MPLFDITFTWVKHLFQSPLVLCCQLDVFLHLAEGEVGEERVNWWLAASDWLNTSNLQWLEQRCSTDCNSENPRLVCKQAKQCPYSTEWRSMSTSAIGWFLFLILLFFPAFSLPSSDLLFSLASIPGITLTPNSVCSPSLPSITCQWHPVFFTHLITIWHSRLAAVPLFWFSLGLHCTHPLSPRAHPVQSVSALY